MFTNIHEISKKYNLTFDNYSQKTQVKIINIFNTGIFDPTDLNSGYLLNIYGNYLEINKKYKEAETTYLKAVELKCQEAMNDIGTFYLGRNKKKKAVEYFTMAMDLGNSDAINNLGNYYENDVKCNKIDKAMEYYMMATSYGNFYAMENLIRMYHEILDTENDEDIKHLLQKSDDCISIILDRLNPLNNSSEQKKRILKNVGLFLMKYKKYEKAIDIFNVMTECGYFQSYLYIGICYKELNKIDEMFAFLNISAETYENTDAYIEIFKYYLQNNDYDNSYKYLDKAFKCYQKINLRIISKKTNNLNESDKTNKLNESNGSNESNKLNESGELNKLNENKLSNNDTINTIMDNYNSAHYNDSDDEINSLQSFNSDLSHSENINTKNENENIVNNSNSNLNEEDNNDNIICKTGQEICNLTTKSFNNKEIYTYHKKTYLCITLYFIAIEIILKNQNRHIQHDFIETLKYKKYFSYGYKTLSENNKYCDDFKNVLCYGILLENNSLTYPKLSIMNTHSHLFTIKNIKNNILFPEKTHRNIIAHIGYMHCKHYFTDKMREYLDEAIKLGSTDALTFYAIYYKKNYDNAKAEEYFLQAIKLNNENAMYEYSLYLIENKFHVDEKDIKNIEKYLLYLIEKKHEKSYSLYSLYLLKIKKNAEQFNFYLIEGIKCGFVSCMKTLKSEISGVKLFNLLENIEQKNEIINDEFKILLASKEINNFKNKISFAKKYNIVEECCICFDVSHGICVADCMHTICEQCFVSLQKQVCPLCNN